MITVAHQKNNPNANQSNHYMNQILTHYRINDYVRFKTAFDAAAENRGHAGLTLLQLWREGGDAVWALYSVSNPAKARDYLSGSAKVFETQAGVTSAEIHMLETV